MSEFSAWPPYKSVEDIVTEPEAFVRMLHASADGSAVDVYANGNLIARGLSYGQMTEYVPVKPGNYSIQVFPAGMVENPVLSSALTVLPETSQTITAIGKQGDLTIFPIREVYMPLLDKRSAYLRFVHLSPNTPPLDITLPDGKVLFSNICYRDYSNYITLPPGYYNLQARETGTDNVLFRIPNVNLAPGSVDTIYAVGLINGEPPFNVLLFTDGVY